MMCSNREKATIKYLLYLASLFWASITKLVLTLVGIGLSMHFTIVIDEKR
jgi:hypothetical protein